MRTKANTLVLLLLCILPGLNAKRGVAQDASQAALERAILGHWTGVLEYRDYSEPATSTKRVQLPTWLTIRTRPEGLRFEYVYDDGPKKTVASAYTVVIDTAAKTWKEFGTEGPGHLSALTGLAGLQEGHGTLMLTGNGTDSGKPAEIRTTWKIDRNLLSALEEVRPAGSAEPFVFRHRYTFTRAEPPPLTPAMP